MKTRSILTIAFVCLGLVAAILPQRYNSSAELDANQLLQEIKLEDHILSVDEVANALIGNDPAFQLIDLRPSEEYQAYSIPGALNIPFDSLFSPNWMPYVDQVARKNVFYSNGTVLASRAWLLTRQKGIQNNYILDGGLNGWYTNILDPQLPESTQGEEDFDLYQSRLGAKQFFTGQGAEVGTSKVKARKPVPRKKKKMVAGGCS